MYGGIVVKMDNSHLFKEVLNFLLHTKAMGNEIYKQHGFFFLHVHVC
jgi:hypothetical protein